MAIKMMMGLCIMGLISGCMMVDQRTFTHVDYHHTEYSNKVTTTLPPAPPKTVKTTPPTPAVTPNVNLRCEPISVPRRHSLPVHADYITETGDIELELAAYINALYKVINIERQELDLAISEHLKSCTE